MIKKVLILIFLCLSFIGLQANEPLLQHTDRLVANGKNVLLLFESKACVYCEVFKKDIKEDKVLHKLLKDNFNVYSISLDEYHDYLMGDQTPPKKTNTTSLKMGFTVKATPQIIMFDENWKKIIQLPGYADPSMMKIFVNYVAKDIYKKEDLNKYLKETGLIN